MQPAPLQWLLSIYQIRRQPPPLRDLPLLLLKCAVGGLIIGPLLSLFFVVLNAGNPLQIFLKPVILLWSMASGVIWSMSFFVCCGLGTAWVRSLVCGYPPSIIGTVLVVYNTIASSFAGVTALLLTAWLGARLGGDTVHVRVPYLWQVLVVDGLIGGVLALVITAFVKLKLEVERAQAELAAKAIETARAQSLALQSQINPHFFFNTLNSISALVDEDPASAKSMIGRLAEMFRYTLGCTHTESVQLEQELQFVRDYLSIEQARFRQRLRVELPEPPLPTVRVPGLVLQPLVENAVKHGIARRIEGGTISIQVARRGESTRVSVRNTADDSARPGEAALYRQGHALENVRARLRLFTGRQDPLHMEWHEDWTEFSFEI